MRAGVTGSSTSTAAQHGHTHEASSTLTTPAGAVISTSSGSEDRTGYLVGGGVEWAFLRNWSAKLECNYLDFGTDTVTRNTSTGETNLRDVKLNMNVFKAGTSTTAFSSRQNLPKRPALAGLFFLLVKYMDRQAERVLIFHRLQWTLVSKYVICMLSS
jgi:hypothetical protein